MKGRIHEIFEDDEGKLSAKRFLFLFCFIVTCSLIYLYGVGHFENNVTPLLETLIWCTFSIILGIAGEKLRGKIKDKIKDKEQ